MKLGRAETAVLAFTCLYVLAFLVYFVTIGNREFIWYILTLVGFMALIGWAHQSVRFPPAMLWGLTIWGIAHMAGGGIRAGSGVLYNLVLFPIAGDGELRLLKYDQVVHFYGFGVTAWVLWHLLDAQFPQLRRTRTIYVFAALASMGLGALNEIIEFTAVMLIANTNVGGYYNTSLDLVFNALGAATAMVVLAVVQKTHARPPQGPHGIGP